MDNTTTRGAKEGLGFGIIAGIIFALIEVAGSAIMGNPALMPFRMFASVALGQSAMQAATIPTVLVVGSLAHLALSGLFGLIYGLINARFSPRTETQWGRQTALGLLFGVVVWFVNFQIIARILYPWFLNAPPFMQMMMHALFFGLPLALMYAAAERHVQHVAPASWQRQHSG